MWVGELTVPAAGSYWVGLDTGGSWETLTLDGTVIARDGPGQAAPVTAAGGLENLRVRTMLTSGTHTIGVTESPDGSGRPVQARLD
jgi:beta-glucosidase